MEGHSNGNLRTKWEYLEVGWGTDQITVAVFSVVNPNVQMFSANQWPMLFAQLGVEGWELTGVVPSPTQEHQFWYYFKRPLSSL